QLGRAIDHMDAASLGELLGGRRVGGQADGINARRRLGRVEDVLNNRAASQIGDALVRQAPAAGASNDDGKNAVHLFSSAPRRRLLHKPVEDFGQLAREAAAVVSHQLGRAVDLTEGNLPSQLHYLVNAAENVVRIG